MVFTGWLAELLLRDVRNKKTPRDVQFWLFATKGRPEGRGRVAVGKQKFIFPFSQDFNSFLVLTKVISHPDLVVPPIGKVTLYLDFNFNHVYDDERTTNETT